MCVCLSGNFSILLIWLRRKKRCRVETRRKPAEKREIKVVSEGKRGSGEEKGQEEKIDGGDVG